MLDFKGQDKFSKTVANSILNFILEIKLSLNHI